MNKIITILILLLFSVLGYTQTESLTKRVRFNFETNVGINISNLKNDSIEFDSGKKPFLGLNTSYNITERFSLQSAVNYSIKGSNSVSPFLKVENQYLDLTFAPQFEILQNFHFYVGVCYSRLLESHKIILTPQGREMINISNYGSELDIFSGIKFPLQENVNLFINYTIPISNTYSSNLQVGISIALNNRIEKEPSYRKKKAEASENQIINLKEGALFVRLKTSENTINALREAGKYDKAEKVKLNQAYENEKIINAFKKNYDFSEVFFFYSYNSEKIRLKQFENIFLNEILEVDSTIEFNSNRYFFIAEFGYLEKDTMKYYSHSSVVPSENGGVELIANYYTPSSDFDFYALRIMDQHFVQLNRPFPYYTRAIYKTIRKHPEQLLFIPPIYLSTLTWTYDHTVTRMNKKLKKYYNKKSKNYR